MRAAGTRSIHITTYRPRLGRLTVGLERAVRPPSFGAREIARCPKARTTSWIRSPAVTNPQPARRCCAIAWRRRRSAQRCPDQDGCRDTSRPGLLSVGNRPSSSSASGCRVRAASAANPHKQATLAAAAVCHVRQRVQRACHAGDFNQTGHFLWSALLHAYRNARRRLFSTASVYNSVSAQSNTNAACAA